MRHMTMRHYVLTILCVVAACQNPGVAGNSLAHDIRSLARPVVEGEVAVGFVVGILSEGENWVGGFVETRLGSQEAPARGPAGRGSIWPL